MDQQSGTYIVKNRGAFLLYIISAIPAIIAFRWILTDSQALVGIDLFITLLFIGVSVFMFIINIKQYGSWIEVSGSVLKLYKNEKYTETMDATNVSFMIVRPIGRSKGHTITLYAQGEQELITLNARAKNIDLLIDLVGRHKLLIKG